ncbi:MAG TPA: glycosyltransferase family 39 protein [Methylomirabilota bacterium]|nr:glycosyltransferase family 39 protein [Methylomirabilota bacterium]
MKISRTAFAGYFCVALLLGFAMVSRDSLWIDEGQTLRFADQPSLTAWFDELRHNRKSEAQMPLGMLSAWIGARIFGTNEWGLRAPNILWVALTGLAFALLGRRIQQRGLFWFLLASPFLWYYANEARPYAMLICSGAWLLYFLIRLQLEAEISSSAVAGLCITSVAGFATHALFAFVVFGVTLAAIPAVFRSRHTITRQHMLVFAATTLGLIALAGYYAWTLQRGASGAKLWSVGPHNIVFSMYELLGFGGLGPPRNTMRDLGRQPAALLESFLALKNLGAIVLAAIYAVLVAYAIRLRHDKLMRAALMVMLGGGAALLAAAIVVRFPFWGRHAAGLLPFALFMGWRAATLGPRGIARVLIISLLFATLIFSSARQRFLPEYGKDDYQLAANLATRASQQNLLVWWSADLELAPYYHVALSTENSTRGVRLILYPSASDLAVLSAADVVIQGKPDIYDSRGELARFLADQRYQPVARAPGFVFWARPGSTASSAVILSAARERR